MRYIQRKCNQFKTVETVDEAETYKEANYLLGEYRLADPYAHYYISQRPCNDWKS